MGKRHAGHWNEFQILKGKRPGSWTVCELYCHQQVVKQIHSHLLKSREDYQVVNCADPMGAQYWIMIHTNPYTEFDSFYPEFGGF